MDNASKALITAGAVLVSILLLTTGVYVVNTQKPEQYVADARDKMWSGVDIDIGLGEDLGENVEKLATNKNEASTTTLRGYILFSKDIPGASIESLVFIDSNTHKAKEGALIEEDVGAVKKGEVMAYAYDNDGDNLYEVVVAQPGGVKANANSGSLLNGANQLTDINLKYLDTSNATNMQYMFANCNSLTRIDASSFNTKNVTAMNHMFAVCTNLKTVDLSSFNTEKVTTIWRCFSGCSSLEHLDLSSFYTPSLTGTGMCLMFENCTNLKSIDLSNFDTTNLTSLQEVFKNCYALESLDLSSFNTSNVTNMNHIFLNCKSLTKLDLTSFDTTKVESLMATFMGCSSLKELNISTFDSTNVKTMNNLFEGCSSLENLTLGPDFVIKKGCTAGNIDRDAHDNVKKLLKEKWE